MSDHNPNARLEIFCDGVIAIAITLLILEIKVPSLESIHSVEELKHELIHGWPHWFGFVLSFMAIFISWANHHNIFKLIGSTSSPFIYANGFFLLTLVVMPFSTALMSEYIQTAFAQPAISLYCLSALVHNVAWNTIAITIKPLAKNAESLEKMMIGIKNTGYAFVLYVFIFLLSFWFPITSMVLITLSWLTWLVIGISMRTDEE